MRRLLDGVAMAVPHCSTEPARPRHRRAMISTQVDRDALVHDLVHPLRAGLGLHVLLPGAARLLQEARY